MFPPVDPILFQVATMALAGLAALLVMRAARMRSLGRAAELRAAANALEAHYEALAAIVDDPALPVDALEMLANLSDGLSDQQFCDGLTDAMTAPSSGSAPRWFDDIQALRKVRPELAANFYKAVSSGLAAAVLRWPGNYSRLASFAAVMAQGDRKEAVLAERLAALGRARSHDGRTGNGGGVPMPA